MADPSAGRDSVGRDAVGRDAVGRDAVAVGRDAIYHYGPDRVDVALQQFHERATKLETQMQDIAARVVAMESVDNEHLANVIRARTDFFAAIYSLEEGMRKLPQRVEELHRLYQVDRKDREVRQRTLDGKLRSQGVLLYIVCAVLGVLLLAVLVALLNIQVVIGR